MTGVPSFGCSHHFSVPLSSVQPSLQSPSLADTCGFATSRTHCVPGVIANAENDPECHPTHLRCSLKYVNPVWLVVLTILKNMKVNGKDYSIYYGKIKIKCLKPPTSCKSCKSSRKTLFWGDVEFCGDGIMTNSEKWQISIFVTKMDMEIYKSFKSSRNKKDVLAKTK